MSAFVNMREFYPEPCSKGEAVIKHFSVGKLNAGLFNVNLRSGGDAIAPGDYTSLHVDGVLMMSDTPMERRSNYGALHNARGDVLIAGMGMGVVLAPILLKPEVKSVTVIEKSQDVIDLVAHRMPNQEKLGIICADVLTWTPPKGRKWDYCWFDIWPDICLDNLEDMKLLHRRFARRVRWAQQSWMRDRLLFEDRREKREKRRLGR